MDNMIKNFIGREKELDQLHKLIDRRGTGISIIGDIGVGKTFLVKEFASQLKEITTEWLISEDSIDLFRKVDNFLLKIRLSNERRDYIVVIDDADRFHTTELQDYLRKILNFKLVRSLIFISQRPFNIPHTYQIHLMPFTQTELISWSQTKEGIIYSLERQRELEILETVRPQIVVVNDSLINKLKSFPEDLYKITPRQFEIVVADLLSDMGWEVKLTKETRDGGKDILAHKDTGIGKILCLVEAKQYSKARPIGIGLVRQLHSTLVHEKANMAMMVTTSTFSQESQKFQKTYEYQLSLKDFTDVISWLVNYKTFK